MPGAIAVKLRVLREERSLTQKEAADRLLTNARTKTAARVSRSGVKMRAG